MAGPQLHRKGRHGSVFHGAVADTEPDGWARRVILRDHAKRRQEARRAGEGGESGALNALDFLLAVDDFSRVGALRFRDEHGVFQRAAEEGRRTAPPLIELGMVLSASRAVGRGLGMSAPELDQFADAFEHGERAGGAHRKPVTFGRAMRQTAPQGRPFRAGDQAVKAARATAGSGA